MGVYWNGMLHSHLILLVLNLLVYHLFVCSSLKTEGNLSVVRELPLDRLLLETGTHPN